MELSFSENLLRWNRDQNKRSMPWKGEKDPYKIWLSEIILQQTRVEQGLAYYNAFVKNFPTVHDLANASEEKVFKLWEGLGYYSRCRNLIASARYIVTAHNGKFPDDYHEILKLKGIGPYTAAAIASFAFDAPFAVVDGNVQRLLSRYFGINTPIDTTAGKRLYQQLADALIDNNHPAEYNQAIMDLGAVICKPQQPLCNQCPQKNDCVAFNNGFVHQLPVKEKKLVKKHRWFYYFMLQSQHGVYIRKRTANDIWQNLHEFLLYETPDAEPVQHHAWLKTISGGQPFTIVGKSAVYKQQLTHQTIHGQFIDVNISDDFVMPEGYIRVDKQNIGDYAFPRMINHFLSDSPL